MKSQRYLVVVLALLTLGGAALGWKQHQELVELRAAALGKDERADLQKRLWDAEKRAKDLADQLLAARGRNAGDASDEGETAAGDSSPTQAQNVQDRRARRGTGGPAGAANAMMAFMDQPEVQKLMAIQQKGQLDNRYAALFKNLNLTPEQLDKFKTLLVERQTAMQDVMAAARAQGISPRDDPEAFRKMIATTQAEVDNNIKATLGEEGFTQYQNFQQTLPQLNLLRQLQQSLSYTSNPLTDAQAEQMVQVLAQTSKTATGNRSQVVGDGLNVIVSAGPGGGGDRGATFNIMGSGGGGAQITNEAIAASQGVLSAPQLQGLQQLQQQQQAQQQLQQAMRKAMSNQTGGRTNSTSTGGATPQPAKKS